MDNETVESPEALYTDYESFRNYDGVELDGTAEEEVKTHLQKKHLRAFDTVEELQAFLGGAAPILSKIGLIIKTKGNVRKVRMILDTKESNLKSCSAKSQRVLLPRLLDAIVQGMHVYSHCTIGEAMDWFVLDFSEAFWQMPLEPSERRYFCCRLVIDGCTKFIVFLRTVQGSRGAPNSWARLAALVMRLTQGLFDDTTVRMHCFVDDPIASIRGEAWVRRLKAASIMLVWEAIGFNLAYRKGQFSGRVDWIGGNLQFTDVGITARVKDTILQDIRDDLKKFSTQNVLAIKEVRSFVGRANHAAGLLLVLRPFLHSIWGAIYGDSGGAPPNTIWRKQIEHALSWLQLFFVEEKDGLERSFTLQEFAATGPCWEIGTDASPWGMGGWLSCDGKIVKFFTCPVTDEDLQVFELQRGSCEGQQTLEGLAILIAMRIWNDGPDARAMKLTVRGDNVGALMLLIKMRPSSRHQAVIARELALITVKTAFPPTVSHTPGIAHQLADGLSRVDDPKHPDNRILQHPALAHASRTSVPPRPRGWYRTLRDPARKAEGFVVGG